MGLELWRGKSQIDGKPIVLLLSGEKGSSRNSKTGQMAQSWILRSDIHPQEALKTGEDISICGNCPHRPKGPNASRRSCYVSMMAPNSIWKAWRSGSYPKAPARPLEPFPSVRMGSYGDPVAVPYGAWIDFLEAYGVSHWTGYTHQWRLGLASPYKTLLMASVDSPSEYDEAKDLGWRTFRVRHHGQELQESEIICPASSEGGYRTTCEKCQLCRGTSLSARDIAIEVHGNGKGYFV